MTEFRAETKPRILQRCSLRGSLVAVLVALFPIASSPAIAEPGILLADAWAGDSETMATGDQLLLTGRDGSLRFAGRELGLAGFSGILGYASETAYVLVIDGEAREGSRRIAAGRMLLIPPYGAPADVQRFDAARLRDRWSETARAAQPEAFRLLGELARRQGTGLFLGRLGRTSFNVAAPRGPIPGSSQRSNSGLRSRSA